MNESILNDPDASEVIEAYRNSILRRYSENNLKKYPQTSHFSRPEIEVFINFFLENMYPGIEHRKRLDNAFQSLAIFAHSPSKFFGLIGNLSSAIFKFGHHLPSAAKAGLSALSSYTSAHKFERVMLSNYKKIKGNVDIKSEKGFSFLFAGITKKEADKFRHDMIRLFQTASDKKIVRKIIEIMENTIQTMKRKNHIYTNDEIAGIEMGYNLMKNGESLFKDMLPERILFIIESISEVEKDFFESMISDT